MKLQDFHQRMSQRVAKHLKGQEISKEEWRSLIDSVYGQIFDTIKIAYQKYIEEAHSTIKPILDQAERQCANTGDPELFEDLWNFIFRSLQDDFDLSTSEIDTILR